MLYDKYNEIVGALSRADSIDEIRLQCSCLSEMAGFEHFQYAAIFPNTFTDSAVIIVSGYPQEWIEHYISKSYICIDPVVLHCCNNIVPIDWEQIKPLEDKNTAICKFMEESREFGLKRGISFPVHAPSREIAILSFASSHEESDSSEFLLKKSIPLVHQAALHVHEAVKRVIDISAILNLKDPLTERERDCLLWTAEGKTSWETAKILRISERTVKFHLQNACEKLNACNRTHAIARAVSTGLIRPNIILSSFPVKGSCRV